MAGSLLGFGRQLRAVPSVQVMGKRSARRQLVGGRPMTAAPQIAAIRASAGRRAQQSLRDSQREYAWQHPPSAIAAQGSSDSDGIRDDFSSLSTRAVIE